MFVPPPIMIMPPDDDEDTDTVWPEYKKGCYSDRAFVVGMCAIVVFWAALVGYLCLDLKKRVDKLDCIKLANHQFIDGACYKVKEIENMPKEKCANITYPTMFKHGKCYLILDKENEQHTR